MHTVKVFNNNGNIVPTHVEIDGKPLRCRSIDYHAEADHIPTFAFEVIALSDIEVNHAGICFKFHPETVTDAVKILRHELIQHGDTYNGFISSIESALNESKPYVRENNLAKAILDRIIGVDENGA